MKKVILADYDTALRTAKYILDRGHELHGPVSLTAPESFRRPGKVEVCTSAPPPVIAAAIRTAWTVQSLPMK